MHYCCYIFSREFPSDKVIDEKLAPYYTYYAEDFYSENTGEDEEHMKEGTEWPAFKWDWWQVGGRYAARFKLDARVEADTDEKYKWCFFPKKPRAGRLFRCQLLENGIKNDQFDIAMSETTKIRYLGIRDKFVYVDGGMIKELINLDYTIKTGCFCYIGLDGNGYARERYDGNNFVNNDDFEARLIEEWYQCEMEGGCYVVCVDLHY